MYGASIEPSRIFVFPAIEYERTRCAGCPEGDSTASDASMRPITPFAELEACACTFCAVSRCVLCE